MRNVRRRRETSWRHYEQRQEQEIFTWSRDGGICFADAGKRSGERAVQRQPFWHGRGCNRSRPLRRHRNAAQHRNPAAGHGDLHGRGLLPLFGAGPGKLQTDCYGGGLQADHRRQCQCGSGNSEKHRREAGHRRRHAIGGSERGYTSRAGDKRRQHWGDPERRGDRAPAHLWRRPIRAAADSARHHRGRREKWRRTSRLSSQQRRRRRVELRNLPNRKPDPDCRRRTARGRQQHHDRRRERELAGPWRRGRSDAKPGIGRQPDGHLHLLRCRRWPQLRSAGQGDDQKRHQRPAWFALLPLQRAGAERLQPLRRSDYRLASRKSLHQAAHLRGFAGRTDRQEQAVHLRFIPGIRSGQQHGQRRGVRRDRAVPLQRHHRPPGRSVGGHARRPAHCASHSQPDYQQLRGLREQPGYLRAQSGEWRGPSGDAD